jgi:hypothetical protein
MENNTTKNEASIFVNRVKIESKIQQKCSICSNEFSESYLDQCSFCGWDLTPYPPILGPIPEGYNKKISSQIKWARESWKRLQELTKKLEELSNQKHSSNEYLLAEKEELKTDELSRTKIEKSNLEKENAVLRNTRSRLSNGLKELLASNERLSSENHQLRGKYNAKTEELSITLKELLVGNEQLSSENRQLNHQLKEKQKIKGVKARIPLSFIILAGLINILISSILAFIGHYFIVLCQLVISLISAAYFIPLAAFAIIVGYLLLGKSWVNVGLFFLIIFYGVFIAKLKWLYKFAAVSSGFSTNIIPLILAVLFVGLFFCGMYFGIMEILNPSSEEK